MNRGQTRHRRLRIQRIGRGALLEGQAVPKGAGVSGRENAGMSSERKVRILRLNIKNFLGKADLPWVSRGLVKAEMRSRWTAGLDSAPVMKSRTVVTRKVRQSRNERKPVRPNRCGRKNSRISQRCDADREKSRKLLSKPVKKKLLFHYGLHAVNRQ